MRKAGRKSMIGGIMALSLILTGTGYAYWTDTLNVTTKATTGDFAVTFVDLGLYAQYGNETMADGWSIVDGIGESGYVNDDFFMRGIADYNSIAKENSINDYYERAKGYNNVDFNAALVDADYIKKDVGDYTTLNALGSDKIELIVNNMYPGYAQAFRTDVLNVGEIAAKLSNLTFDVRALEEMGNPDAAYHMLGIAVLINQEQYKPDDGIDGAKVFKLCDTLGSGDNFFTVGGVDFLRLSALNDADVKAAITNAEILCSPATDNRMDLYLAVAMDPDADGVYTTGTSENLAANDDAASQNKGVKISIDFLWDQFNVGKDTGNPNILVDQNVSR